MKSYQIEVAGRVQGVWFRKFTKNIAKKLGVNGEVKNLSNGNVEIRASFSDDWQFEKFIKEIKKGPTFARVDSVDIKRVEEVFSDGFRIVK